VLTDFPVADPADAPREKHRLIPPVFVTELYFLGPGKSQAARFMSFSATSRNLCEAGSSARTASLSSRSTSRCNALRLSTGEGRRVGSSQGLCRRSTSPSADYSQAHASTTVGTQALRLKAPTLAEAFRSCCWPAPHTSLRSLLHPEVFRPTAQGAADFLDLGCCRLEMPKG
jgi:hypothetical protein